MSVMRASSICARVTSRREMESVEEGPNHQGLTVDAFGSQLLLTAEVVAVSSDRLRIRVGRMAVWL